MGACPAVTCCCAAEARSGRRVRRARGGRLGLALRRVRLVGPSQADDAGDEPVRVALAEARGLEDAAEQLRIRAVEIRLAALVDEMRDEAAAGDAQAAAVHRGGRGLQHEQLVGGELPVPARAMPLAATSVSPTRTVSSAERTSSEPAAMNPVSTSMTPSTATRM